MTQAKLNVREAIEAHEEAGLADYACKSRLSEGREYPEPEHPHRSAFQRDRDRIIHSKAFRRLEYKTQVFVNHEGDHYRTRLTHTLEVAQIARTAARILRVNEDLAESIALAHDLGHPPFGHSGQDAMNELMIGAGGFEHNRQSLRIVTQLEHRYAEFPGLNLTRELLEGLSKHFTDYDVGDGRGFERHHAPSLEAQLANYCDEIAYNNHDLDDGLRSGMIDLDQLASLELWAEHYELIQKKYGNKLVEEIQVTQTIRSIINHLVMDMLTASLQQLHALNITSLYDVYEAKEPLIVYSATTRKKNTELKRFLYSKLYRHYRVERMADKASRVIRDLFEAYCENPRILPPQACAHIDITDEVQLKRAVCDYIAGMTDRFALDEHDKLFDPHSRV